MKDDRTKLTYYWEMEDNSVNHEQIKVTEEISIKAYERQENIPLVDFKNYKHLSKYLKDLRVNKVIKN